MIVSVYALTRPGLKRELAIYCITGIVVGGFFTTSLVFFPGIPEIEVRSLSAFFALYLVSLLSGWFTLLIFALLLRRLAGSFARSQVLRWAILGGLLAPVLLWSAWAIGTLMITADRLMANRVPLVARLLLQQIFTLLLGPMLMVQLLGHAKGTFVVMLAGIATAVALSWVSARRAV